MADSIRRNVFRSNTSIHRRVYPPRAQAVGRRTRPRTSPGGVYARRCCRWLMAQVTLSLDPIAFANLTSFRGSRINNLVARGLQTLPQIAGFCRGNNYIFFRIIYFYGIHNPKVDGSIPSSATNHPFRIRTPASAGPLRPSCRATNSVPRGTL